jgi:hypothetical protein
MQRTKSTGPSDPETQPGRETGAAEDAIRRIWLDRDFKKAVS